MFRLKYCCQCCTLVGACGPKAMNKILLSYYPIINVNGGIFGVVTHSGLFRGHLLPGTKIRNDTFGTYFLVQQLTTNQWHIVWLYLSIVKLIPCTENLFVAFVLHGNIKTTGLLRSGFSLGDLRYASSLWRKVHGHWGPWGCKSWARVKIVSRNCIDFV